MGTLDLGALHADIEIDAKESVSALKAFETAVADATGRLENLGKAGEECGKKVDKVDQTLGKVSATLSKVGKGLTTYVTGPIIAAGTAVAKFGMDFEYAMSKVATLAGGADMGKLRQEVLDISNATGIAAAQLAEAQLEALSSGVSADQTYNILMASAKAAKGGFTDALNAVNGLTNALNAYGIAAEHSEELANKFLITQNLGKTTFDDIAANIGKVAPTAYSAGMSIDELLASVTALTSMGIATETSMVGIKAALSNIIKPSKQAQDEAKRLGLEFSVAALQSKGWAVFLDEVNTKTEGNLDSLGKLFGSTQALNSILTLTSNNGGALMAEALAEMEANTTALNDAYELMIDNTSTRLQMSLNEAKNAAISFFDALAPIIETGAKVISGIAQKLSELDDVSRKNVVTVALVAAAIGPLLLLLGKTVGAINAIQTALVAMGVSANAAMGWLGLLALAIGAVVAIAAVCAAKYREQNKEALALRDATKKLKETQDQVTQATKDTIGTLETAAVRAQPYIDRLKEIEQITNRTKAEQSEYARIVRTLNEIMPGLNLKLNEQTGLLEGGAAALAKQIALWKQRALQQAYEDEYVAMLREQINLTKQKQAAQNALNEAEHALYAARIKKGLAVSYNEATGGKLFGAGQWERLQAGWRLQEAEDTHNLLLTALIAADEALAGSQTRLTELDGIIDSVANSNGLLTDSQGELAGETKNATKAIEDNTAAAKANKKAIVDAYMVSDEAREKMNAYTDSIINGFKRIGRERVNFNSATRDLKANNDDMEAWRANLKSMEEQGFDPKVVETLKGLGVEYRGLVAEMEKKGVEKSEPLSEQILRAAELAKQQVKAEAEAMADAMMEADPEFNAAGQSGGAAYGDGVVAGANSKHADAYNSGAALANAMNSGFKNALEIASPSRAAARNIGYYAAGITGETQNRIAEVEAAGATFGFAYNSGFTGLQASIGGIHGGTIPTGTSQVLHNISTTNNNSSSKNTRLTVAPNFSNRRMTLAEQSRYTRKLSEELLGLVG
ncbi:MAG: phage tail tape measure protein [Clostridiales bacterium]|nr:phage tail tape measure protein [Clostridiales bacterium]